MSWKNYGFFYGLFREALTKCWETENRLIDFELGRKGNSEGISDIVRKKFYLRSRNSEQCHFIYTQQLSTLENDVFSDVVDEQLTSYSGRSKAKISVGAFSFQDNWFSYGDQVDFTVVRNVPVIR